VRGELTEANLANILAGELDSGAHLVVERCDAAGGEAANRWYTLVARGASGKEVRQLFERQGAIVSRVQRVRFGPLALERALGRSQFRELAQEELDALLAPVAPAAAGAAWTSKERPLTP
jgi:16S rRNA U516 pseudouridylate synthase RsuA-like enzyme